jgi:hypothetical protein
MNEKDDTREKDGLEVDRDTTSDIIVNKPNGDKDG